MIAELVDDIKKYFFKENNFVPIFQNKNFVRLWSIQILSQITANMLNFILMIYVFEKTGSTIAVGVLLAFYALPSVILGPFSGTVVDIWDRKKILVFSSLLQAVFVLSYLGIGNKVWPVYSIIFFYSLCDEFFGPAIGATILAVVKKEALPAANTLFTLTNQGSFIVGYLLGGILLRLVSGQLFFPLASILLLIAAVIAYFIPRNVLPKKEKVKISIADFQSLLMEGYRFIKNERRVLFPIILLALLQIIIGFGVIVLPSFSKQVLQINLSDSSFVVLIPAVIGGLIGSILIDKYTKIFRKRKLITAGLFALGITLVLLALSGAIVKPPTLLSVPTAIIMGISFMFVNVPLQTLLQESTPLAIRGRVYGVLSMVITLAAAIPSLIAATFVDILGVTTVMAAIGIALAAISIYVEKGRNAFLRSNYRS